METIQLEVLKTDIWNEVAKTSSYSGAKMTDDKDAYDRMMVTDEDMKEWQRFWEESAVTANDRLREMIQEVGNIGDDYKVTLEVSKSYDKVLTPSVQTSLKSFFVLSITGKWYQFTNKKEAADYLVGAEAMMTEVLRKLYSRRKPKRPTKFVISYPSNQ